MGNIWVDLGAKTASVEVTITNPKTPEANLGNLGRASIADVNLTGATIVSDPTTRTVSVQNASATLQAVTAETLNSVFINPIEKATKEPQAKFAGGDPLGIFSFTAQTE
jgi:secreted PhoX family phosphatase